jgi:hypothetical protein
MTATRPFLRRCELLVWPTTEAMPNQPAQSALRFVSDGSRTGFNIAFCIHRTVHACTEWSEITIHNLKAETRAALQTLYCRVELRVGWENYGTHTLFIGSLRAAITVRQGPDFVTTLRCAPGDAALNESIVTNSYPAGMPVRQLVEALADTLHGVNVDPKRISCTGKIGPGGLSFGGTTRDLLDRLANQHGFTWSIQNGTFQAINDDSTTTRTIRISSRDGTLFSAQPILESALQFQRAIEVCSMLIPDLLPGDRVQLESDVSPHLNGNYMLNEVTYTGSPCTNDWKMVSKIWTVGQN